MLDLLICVTDAAVAEDVPRKQRNEDKKHFVVVSYVALDLSRVVCLV